MQQLLAKEKENCFFSPFSIFNALLLTYIGAKGQTAEEITKYLHLPADKVTVLNGVRALLNQLKVMITPENWKNLVLCEFIKKFERDLVQTTTALLNPP